MGWWRAPWKPGLPESHGGAGGLRDKAGGIHEPEAAHTLVNDGSKKAPLMEARVRRRLSELVDKDSGDGV